MRRIVTLVVVALVMVAMLLAMVGPAMAQGVGSACPEGTHPEVVDVFPGHPGVLIGYTCVPNGSPS